MATLEIALELASAATAETGTGTEAFTDTTPTPSPRRYMNIDLERCLGVIANRVIDHFKNDWNTDLAILRNAAVSDNPEDKRLIWDVSSYGTHLLPEHDVFIRHTPAFNAITNYIPYDAAVIFGYYVEVIGYENGIIKGNVFETGDYVSFLEYIYENARPLYEISLTYANTWGGLAGKTITVPRCEYDWDKKRLMKDSGDVTAIRYHSYEGADAYGDLMNMSKFLRRERSKRMTLPIGNEGELLDRVSDELARMSMREFG